MHSPTALALLALNICTTNAEFWVAKASLSTSIPGPVDPSIGGWQWIFPSDANDCDSAADATLYNMRDDVSGDKRGVRIVFSDDHELFEKLEPLVVEWNTDNRHETWYEDREGAYVDLGDNVRGYCVVDHSVFNE